MTRASAAKPRAAKAKADDDDATVAAADESPDEVPAEARGGEKAKPRGGARGGRAKGGRAKDDSTEVPAAPGEDEASGDDAVESTPRRRGRRGGRRRSAAKAEATSAD